MVSEQQASKELMVRNWSISYFEELGIIDAALKEVGILPGQLLQLIEATTELKDADFRAAAFDLLELRKRTGKSSKEAEAYIKQLDSQITAKEKQGSDWTGKIEKAKGELRGWEQKRNDERVKFESEQAKNKRTLKEEGEKLNLELSENNEVRANIAVTVWLEAELKKIGIDLEIFKAIVWEAVLKAGITPTIAKAINEAVKTFGSLVKAIAKSKKVLLNLSKEEKEKKDLGRVLDKSITLKEEKSTEVSKLLDSRTKLLLDWDEEIEKKKWQWEFFQTFISMLLASPSAPDSLQAIAVNILRLEKKGWTHYGGETLPEQRRAAFLTIVMGVYLHSIHCSRHNCGASFIVNKSPDAYNRLYKETSYQCPVCHSPSYTKPDDTFFDLMVSPELAEKMQNARNFLNQLGKMETGDIESLGEKLKLIDNIPPEVYKYLREGGKLQFKA